MKNSFVFVFALLFCINSSFAQSPDFEYDVEVDGDLEYVFEFTVGETPFSVGGSALLNFNGNIVGAAVAPVDVTAPAAPTDFVATAGDGEVVLTWTEPADLDLDRYWVQYAVNGDFPVYVPITVDAPATTYTVTGLTNGTEYLFRIQAFDSSDNGSDYAGPETATPASAELDIPAMDDLIALYRPVDAEVDAAETTAGQTFWTDASAAGGNDGLVVSSTQNPTYTSGESLNFVSSDALGFSPALNPGAMFDVFFTVKFTGAGSFYILYESSVRYMRLFQSSGIVECRVFGTGSQAFWNNAGDGVSLPIDQWFLVRLRRDSSSAVSLFIDGELVSQKTFSPNAATWAAGSLISAGNSASIGHICVFDANVADTPAAALTTALMTEYGIE